MQGYKPGVPSTAPVRQSRPRWGWKILLKGLPKFPVGPRSLQTLTHALRGLVAVTPLPGLQALCAGLLAGLQLEALVAMVHGFRSHCVLLAKDDSVLWGSGNSTGESWEGGGEKHSRGIGQLPIYYGFTVS